MYLPIRSSSAGLHSWQRSQEKGIPQLLREVLGEVLASA
ncbi:hypothetical protein HaLaN_24329 [Haematococcus lacustris]|uniref:Uncharacterized protein n=1 Tax=Haematococcus lacustris TaxID=44745 RepID=A0A6A0A185_HAELA|nr:hypothetical protein HaLaN_24329 [Haematococcus lacustris]